LEIETHSCISLCNMKSVTVFVVAFALLFSLQASGQDIADRLWRTFLVFSPIPLTMDAAVSAGWTNYISNCNSNLGLAYSVPSGGPSKDEPITAFYTSGGQIAGVGVTIWTDPPQTLSDYWAPLKGSSGGYTVTVSFRDASTGIMCSGQNDSSLAFGDRLVIGQGSLDFIVPNTRDEAFTAEFTRGGCITWMGRHFGYDLQAHPEMSWLTQNLIPIMPMYNEDTAAVSAFLVNVPNWQDTEPVGDWEGPFPNSLWCKNYCNSTCPTYNAKTWSTIHFMLTDPENNSCASAC